MPVRSSTFFRLLGGLVDDVAGRSLLDTDVAEDDVVLFSFDSDTTVVDFGDLDLTTFTYVLDVEVDDKDDSVLEDPSCLDLLRTAVDCVKLSSLPSHLRDPLASLSVSF